MWQAEDARERGQLAEDQRATKTRLQIGAQRAALASRGADINSGSALDIYADTVSVGKMDTLTIRDNTKREVWERKMAAANAEGDAGVARWQAGNLNSRADSYESNSWIGVGANLISGASSVSEKWLHYKTKLPGW